MDIVDFFAGCIGGIAGVCVGKPFDTVKVRLITDNAANPRYKGVFDCVFKISKTESVYGFYKGVMSPIYGQAAINAVIFGVHSNVLRAISENKNSLSANFVAGVTAGACQSVICSPVELVRIRMETQGIGVSHLENKSKALYKSPGDCLAKIYKTEGVSGVYRGFVTTVLREGPSFGVYFLSYEWLCQRIKGLLKQPLDTDLSTGPILLCGGLAGMLTWFSTYPVDVIKTRMQEDRVGKYKGNIDCLKKCFAEGGVRTLYKGLGVTLVRAFPTNAATFAAYEYSKRAVKEARNKGMTTDGYFTIHAKSEDEMETAARSEKLHASIWQS